MSAIEINNFLSKRNLEEVGKVYSHATSECAQNFLFLQIMSSMVTAVIQGKSSNLATASNQLREVFEELGEDYPYIGMQLQLILGISLHSCDFASEWKSQWDEFLVDEATWVAFYLKVVQGTARHIFNN